MTPVKVMLAASEILALESLPYPLMLSPKIDGVRSVPIEGQLYSRKMLPAVNPFVIKWAADYGHVLHGLDGEMVVGPPTLQSEDDDVFNRSNGPLGRQDGEPDFMYHVFERWNAPTVHAWGRYMELRETLMSFGEIPRVQIVHQDLVHNAEDALKVVRRHLQLGYEGTMGKRPDKLYKYGRSTINEGILVKFKEFADSEAQIISWRQSQTNQNVAGKDALGHTKRSTAKAGKKLVESLAGWVVRDIYSGVIFKCPATGTAEQAALLWASREHDIGKVVRYKFQKIGTINKPRFPGFKCFVPRSELNGPHPFLDVDFQTKPLAA